MVTSKHEDEQSIGTGDYIVTPGDCLASIAMKSGHLWDTIWDHPANAELKQARGNPNVLRAGDRITIPPLRRKYVTCATGRSYRFVIKGRHASVSLKMCRDGEPIANTKYVVHSGARTINGRTDADGIVEFLVPADATLAELVLGEDPDTQLHYRLALGELDPIGCVRGLQQRLKNLGYYHGPGEEILGPRTRAAIEAFQATNGLRVTGEANEQTRQRLIELHSC